MVDKIPISIYRSDHAWLQRAQRELSAKEDTWLPIHEVFHKLVEAIQAAQEEA
jgi:hypothetical protein